MASSKRENNHSLFFKVERKPLLSDQKEEQKISATEQKQSYGAAADKATVITSSADYLTYIIAQLQPQAKTTRSEQTNTISFIKNFFGSFFEADPWPFGMDGEALMSLLQQLTLAGFKINYLEIQTRQGLIKQLNQVAKEIETSPDLRDATDCKLGFNKTR